MITQPNCLYVIATPIGNLADMTYRAVELLKRSSVIVCEDTRVTSKLLNRYDISGKKLITYNKDLEFEQTHFEIASYVRSQGIVCMVSDAGSPCVSDPGSRLIAYLVKEGLEIDFLPGACSVINSLVLSGFTSNGFSFLGFCPKTLESRKVFFEQVPTKGEGIYIFFDTAERIEKTLSSIESILGDQEVAICREMTKINQEVIRGSIIEILKQERITRLKGEMAVVLNYTSKLKELKSNSDELISASVLELFHQGLATKDIARIISVRFGISKNYAYKLTCQRFL